jgi:hypothetical protein
MVDKKSKSNSLLSYFHEHIQTINNSKIFAGIMIITLNIVSKFVNIKLSKTMESYLKYTFSKYVLVFTIAWMGTRDIYIAFFIMFCFILIGDYLLDEESYFCILPEEFKDHHLTMLEENENMEIITDEEITKAKKVLEKAKEQKKDVEFESFKI